MITKFKRFYTLKKIIFFLIIVLLSAAVYGLYLYHKQHTDVSNIKPAVSISAIELYAAFEKDETDANKKYIDKVIEVKGIVYDVQQSDTTINILLKDAQSMGGINCNIFRHSNKNIHTIVKGSSIIIKGKCVGYLMDVNLVDCVIE